MNVDDFEEILEVQLDKIRGTLIVKAGEYAPDGDRMHNFKIAAALNSETPEQALWGMLTKHIVSVRDMVKSGENFPEGKWDEKLGDILVYGILLRALVVDTGRSVAPPSGYIKS